jgi:hypothetical protein
VKTSITVSLRVSFSSPGSVGKARARALTAANCVRSYAKALALMAADSGATVC